jgi:hypothetical protein
MRSLSRTRIAVFSASGYHEFENPRTAGSVGIRSNNTTNPGVRIGQSFMKRRPKRRTVEFELTAQGERRSIPHIPIGVATRPHESVDNRRRIVWHQAMYGCVSEVGTRMLDEW